MDINAYRASLKPVGDPFDWENNEDYLHPDNFRIRLCKTFEDAAHYINTGEKRNFVDKDEMLKELFRLAEEVEREEQSE
jgi:hypothetical protein